MHTHIAWCAMLLVLLVHGAWTQRDDWCLAEHDHSEGEEALPHVEDFLVELFQLYGDNATCRMLEEGRSSTTLLEKHRDTSCYTIWYKVFYKGILTTKSVFYQIPIIAKYSTCLYFSILIYLV